MVDLYDFKQEPIINYPTSWDFKVILEREKRAGELFESILKQREFKYKASNLSKNGRYQSYSLSVYVDGKENRLSIFAKLKEKSKFVL